MAQSAGERLCDIRMSMGTQKEFAEANAISQAEVSMIEGGKREKCLIEWALRAHTLGLTLVEFLEDVDYANGDFSSVKELLQI